MGMGSTEPQRWARVPPGLAWKRPGLPSDWVRVLERHPDGVPALAGYVWLDLPEKAQEYCTSFFEIEALQ